MTDIFNAPLSNHPRVNIEDADQAREILTGLYGMSFWNLILEKGHSAGSLMV